MHRTVLCSLLALALTTACKRETIDPASPDADGDGITADIDCNDSDALVFPDAEELCDGIDNNCNDEIDEDGATDAQTWYRDADDDGIGSDAATLVQCAQPDGYSATPGDCNDANADVRPNATEVCDGVDNNCDGVVDTDAADRGTWYADADADGYGDTADSVVSCEVPDGYVESDLDCDDTNTAINPDVEEVCDSVDNNCDDIVDTDAVDRTTAYADTDTDGYGDPLDSVLGCEIPDGYVESDLDCDDTNAAINLDAQEVCDSVDNNCDGRTDEDQALDAVIHYADSDSDSFGDSSDLTASCEIPAGRVVNDTDCDDSDSTINPDATEVCDGVDNDCDQLVDDDSAEDVVTAYADTDNDGYGDPGNSALFCDVPSDHVLDNSDCDDTRATVYPGAPDRPGDGLDNDCAEDGDYIPTLYVIDRYIGELWALNRMTGERIWTAETGDENIDVAVGPDGDIYATSFQLGNVVRFSAEDGAVVQTYELGLGFLHGIQYDFSTDTLIVAVPSQGVFEFDPETGDVELLVENRGSLIGAFRLAGETDVYFTSRTEPGVWKGDPTTGLSERIATPTLRPNLLVPSAAGGFYVSGQLGEVEEVGVAGQLPRAIGQSDLILYGSCADPLGGDNLIANDHTDATYTVDTSTGEIVALATGLGTTWGCASDLPADADADGAISAVLGGPDCDDYDATIGPDAVDDTVDGIDQNCDRIDGQDADNDGVIADVDCDDGDAAVYPGVAGCPTTAETCAQLIGEVSGAQSGPHTLADGAVVYCDMALMTGGWTLVARSLIDCDGTPGCTDGALARTDVPVGWNASTGDYDGATPYSKDINSYAGPVRELAVGTVTASGDWGEHIYTHVSLPSDLLTTAAVASAPVGPAMTVRGECGNGPTMLDYLANTDTSDRRAFGDNLQSGFIGFTAGGWSLAGTNDCAQTGQLNDWAGQIMVR